MAKNKNVPLRIEEEWFRAITALAGTYGVSAEDVVRQSLPDEGAIGLFFQCRDYLSDLRWDEVAEVGREATLKHLRDKYMEGLEQHMARLGLAMDAASPDDIDAAKKRALAEMRADTDRPLDYQIEKAEQDSVYLGYLYDAWKRAAANEPGYTIAQVKVDWGGIAGKDTIDRPATAWAVLKNEAIV